MILSLSNTAFANENVTVQLNGEVLEFDVQPQIINGRTLVPMRVIFENLGAAVEWDDNTRTVTAQNDNITVRITIDDTTLLF